MSIPSYIDGIHYFYPNNKQINRKIFIKLQIFKIIFYNNLHYQQYIQHSKGKCFAILLLNLSVWQFQTIQ